MNDETKIAGCKTVGDWKKLRDKLRDSSDHKLWEEAYDFFATRLKTRYFDPINAIKSQDKQQGEGFSITVILCSLIEFLETTYTGKKYKYCSDDKLKKYEYKKSQKEFISFLRQREPFKKVFSNQKKLASDFYRNVRCGLLHEASTKLNWVIRTNDENRSDFYEFKNGEHVVYRNLFEIKIKEFLDSYKAELLKDRSLQEAFVRKMNSIAGLE